MNLCRESTGLKQVAWQVFCQAQFQTLEKAWLLLGAYHTGFRLETSWLASFLFTPNSTPNSCHEPLHGRFGCFLRQTRQVPGLKQVAWQDSCFPQNSIPNSCHEPLQRRSCCFLRQAKQAPGLKQVAWPPKTKGLP